MPILHIITHTKDEVCGYLSVNGECEKAFRGGCYFLPDDLQTLEYHTISEKKRRWKYLRAIDKDIGFTMDYHDLPENFVIELYVYPEGKRIPYGPGYREYSASDIVYRFLKSDAAVLKRILRKEKRKKSKREKRENSVGQKYEGKR